MDYSKETYFQRQTIISEFGEEGQQKLQQTKVLVIGCGGLGSPAAIYLATSGIGVLHLVDFDVVSVSNLHRQTFYDLDDVGKNKAEVLASKIQKKTPHCEVSFSTKPLTKENAKSLIEQFDIVLDGTDHLPTKYLINDVCVLLKKPLVYGSLYKFDGYVASFNLQKEDGEFSTNLRDAFPEISKDVPNCEEAGTLNPIVGIIALMQVNEVLKIASGVGESMTDELVIFNALKNSQFKLNLKSTHRDFDEIFKTTSYEHVLCSTQNSAWLISNSELKAEEGNYKIFNLTNRKESEIPFQEFESILFRDFNVEEFNPNQEEKYVFVCNKGISSYTILERVKKIYPELEAFSLVGGLENY